MASPADIRLVQLARMLGPGVRLDPGRAATATLSHHADGLAATFFAEAAANDDVTSSAAARDYLDGRLRFFAGLLDDATAVEIRAAFEERLRAWDA